jgi:hypothetical protein
LICRIVLIGDTLPDRKSRVKRPIVSGIGRPADDADEKIGGPGRTRTCDNAVMSGRKKPGQPAENLGFSLRIAESGCKQFQSVTLGCVPFACRGTQATSKRRNADPHRAIEIVVVGAGDDGSREEAADDEAADDEHHHDGEP